MTIKSLDCREIERFPKFVCNGIKDLSKFLNDENSVVMNYSPDRYNRIINVEALIRKLFRNILISIFIYSIVSLFSSLPFDIRNRLEKSLVSFGKNRESCFQDYMDNLCNSTDAPEMISYCEQLTKCIEEPFSESMILAFINYLFELKDIFFTTLSATSSLFLGFVSGSILFALIR